MRLNEVLAKISNISKSDIHYWESRGYIKPARVHKRRIDRRDYAPVFKKIKLMADLYQNGLTPEEAHKKAEDMLSRKSKASLVSVAKMFIGSGGNRPIFEAIQSNKAGKLLGSFFYSPSFEGTHEKFLRLLGTPSDLHYTGERLLKILKNIKSPFLIVMPGAISAVAAACSIAEERGSNWDCTILELLHGEKIKINNEIIENEGTLVIQIAESFETILNELKVVEKTGYKITVVIVLFDLWGGPQHANFGRFEDLSKEAGNLQLNSTNMFGITQDNDGIPWMAIDYDKNANLHKAYDYWHVFSADDLKEAIAIERGK